MRCRCCSEHDVVAGVLCGTCVSRLCGSTPLCPEQIESEHDGTAVAGLIDRWGRVNLLGLSTRVGREQEGLSILEPSVSRRHAVVECSDGVWQVLDSGSSNGTSLNGTRIVGRADLHSGDTLFFGDVGFLFLVPLPDMEPITAANPTWMPAPNEEEDEENQEETFSGLRDGKFAIFEHSGGAGGVLEFGGSAVQLTLVQYELFRVLRQRMSADQGRDERVRGFVRSSELLGSLPWDTARADENHLKQLIRRVRRTLARAAVPDVIEARHGFGYRLRVRTQDPQK